MSARASERDKSFNCGRKRMMTREEAEAQRIARVKSEPRRRVRVYKCEKCGTYHTTTDWRMGINNRIWDKIKSTNGEPGATS
jgi:hypothetical protein